MDGMKQKISEAKKAGYNDDEIVEFLAASPDIGEQINNAIGAQYSSKEILSFLTEQKSKAYEEGTKQTKP